MTAMRDLGAPDRRLDVGGVPFAYREVGSHRLRPWLLS